ncbi:anti-sigma factor antagonist [Streptomyces sp. NPDC003011]
MSVIATRHGDRVAVTVRGELDLQAEQQVRRALRSALAESDQGLELDLSGVEFCDCSTLNVLLGIRQQALGESKSVTLRATSPVVDRVLELTDTRSLFTAAGTGGRHGPAPRATESGAALTGADPTTPPDPGDGAQDPSAQDPSAQDPSAQGKRAQDLRIELAQLRRAMQTRPTIDLARGILMASFGLSPEDAWTTLVVTSQNTNTKMHHVAQELVDTVNGDSLTEDVRKQLSAAISTLRHPAATTDDE